MIDHIRHRWDYTELPPRLVAYLAVVSILGPAVALIMGRLLPRAGWADDWLVILIFGALAGLAERFPVHLAHKTHVNVATAVYVAIFLTLPPGTACTLILLSTALAQSSRMVADPDMGISEPLFNAGQTALYTSLTALVVTAAGFGYAGATGVDLLTGAIAGVTLHLGNTLLVAGAASLHLQLPFPRVWRQNLTLDLVPHIALTLIGFVAAELAMTEPFLILILALPAVLIHRAVEDSVTLREDTHMALASLVEIIELRDPYTAGHSRRVASTARLLALELGLSAEEADEIQAAGEVHDIGKVAIDPAILGKPGKLTDTEWTAMRLHPVFGAEVIGKFSSYRNGAAVVRAHHESMDGTGYPDQIAGAQIPQGARILAVADTFDALTSDRPYRDGMSLERALDILTEGAGTQWDSEVVEALVRLATTEPMLVPVFRRSGEQSERAFAA